MAKRKINWGDVTTKIKESEKKVSYTNNDGYSENLFTPKLTDDGTYEGLVRFLPRPENDGDGVPFVKLMNHGFKDVGGWFIDNCPTTIGQKCPVCESNSNDWKSGNQQQASARGRRTSFFSNIIILKDPQTPENEGKVFIFRYGKKIHEKIMERITPKEGSIDEPVQVYDYEEGQNFKLKIKKIKTTINGQERTYNNYDQSSFSDVCTAICDGDDKKIDKVDKQLFPLGEIIEEGKFKSYDVLSKKFADKIGQKEIRSVSDDLKKSNSDPEQESVSSGFNANDVDTDADFFKKIRNEN